MRINPFAAAPTASRQRSRPSRAATADRRRHSSAAPTDRARCRLHPLPTAASRRHSSAAPPVLRRPPSSAAGLLCACQVYRSYLLSLPPIIPPRRNSTKFCTKTATEICAKKFPSSPLWGERGNGKRPIDGAKSRRYYAGQANAERQRPANHRRPTDSGERKEGVNVSTPNTGELLVQQAQEAERLRLLILADECKTLDEFRDKLRERLNK